MKSYRLKLIRKLHRHYGLEPSVAKRLAEAMVEKTGSSRTAASFLRDHHGLTLADIVAKMDGINFKQPKPLKQGGSYPRLWRVVDGAVRDAFLCHPDYLPQGREAVARLSIVKRVVGAVVAEGHRARIRIAEGRLMEALPK